MVWKGMASLQRRWLENNVTALDEEVRGTCRGSTALGETQRRGRIGDENQAYGGYPWLSTVLTHPLFVKEYEKLKKEQMKPNFLDMVSWYSGASADLFKTAAMSRVDDGKQQGDLLYNHFSEKDDFWFDFMVNTSDGGNSSYAIARLLVKPFFRTLKDDSELTLLLIGGDLA
ncbi:hypothetical protein SESBI_47566 [Sesbania bispinosa]|nr:hypothetical protein SESBI_47566 [Sesbania bispinosa]